MKKQNQATLKLRVDWIELVQPPRLDQNDLLRPLDDEVPPGVQRALPQPRQLLLAFPRRAG